MIRRLAILLPVVLVVAGGLFWYSQQAPKKPNVVVVLIDTLRADHLGHYGYARPTSPNLDQFARENVAYRYAITAAPWTPVAVASIFTGLYPSSHGHVPPNSRETAKEDGLMLSPEVETIAERLQAAGYATGAISSNPWITPEFGFDQGFEKFWTKVRAPAEEMTTRAKAALEYLKKQEKPFFLYVHYLDPHDPYSPPAPYNTMFSDTPPGEYGAKEQEMLNLYDGEIRYTDEWVGKLFDHLKSEGLYDDSAIIVVADHGEQFGEHGDHGHGFQLFNTETHVPLFVKVPDRSEQGVIENTVSSTDLYPTILAFAGLSDGQNGKPGVSLLDRTALASREGVTSEISRKYVQLAFVDDEGKKLIVGSAGEVKPGEEAPQGVVGLFDGKGDPAEKRPIEDPSMTAQFHESLEHATSLALENRVKPSDTMKAKMKDSTIDQLKSLGYLQ
jgi:arylsulfatase A-like enzyme